MAIKTSQYLDSVGLERFYGILNSSWWNAKWKESWNSSVGSMIIKDDTNVNNITNGRVVTGINANADGTITYQTAPLNITDAIGSLNLDVLVRMNALTVDSNKEYPILSAPSDVKTGDIKESYYKSNITINPHNNTISTWSGELKGGVYGYASAIGTYTDNKWTAASVGSLTRYIYLENGEFKLGDPIPQGTVTSVNIIQGNGIIVTDTGTPILNAGERTISLAAHAVNNDTYGVGTDSKYGHVKVVTGDLNGKNATDGYAASQSHTHGQYLLATDAKAGTVTSITPGIGLTGTNNSDTAITTSGTINLKQATSSELGGVKIAATRTSSITVTTGKTTDNRYYGVELDSTGKAFVNVPWVDTDNNTHWTTRIHAGASGTATNSATSNPYIKVSDDNTYRSQIQIKGGGATTVSSDVNGVITISSTDTDNDSWRPVQVNGISIANNTLNLKAGTNVSLTNSNGAVTIASSMPSHSHSFDSITDKITYDNELNFVPAGGVQSIYVNHRSDSGDFANVPTNVFIFCDGTGVDKASLQAQSYIVEGGTSSQFLKGDGSLDSNSYLSLSTKYAGSSSVGGAATSANKVNTNLTIKLNSGTTEGANLFTFNGSTAKTINITPSAIGAATAGHTHNNYIASGSTASLSRLQLTTSEIINTLESNYVPTVGTVYAYCENTFSKTGHTHSYAPTSHASSTTTYGVGTTSNYGHVKISNGDCNTVSSANGLAAGMNHTHSNYIAIGDTVDDITAKQVTLNSDQYALICTAQPWENGNTDGPLGYADGYYLSSTGLNATTLRATTIYENGTALSSKYQAKGTYSTSDTKNTAGSTNTSSKIFLIGATSQADNPQTYSNASCYASGGCLYSNGTKVAVEGHLHTSTYLKLSGGTVTGNLSVTGITDFTGVLTKFYSHLEGYDNSQITSGGNPGQQSSSEGLTWKIYSGGTACFYMVDGTFKTPSDIRRKEILNEDIPLTIEQIAKAPTIEYKLKQYPFAPSQVGSISQYWQNVVPQVVFESKNLNDDSTYYSLDYAALGVVSSIKIARHSLELEEKVKSLQEENNKLKSKLASLEYRLAEIEEIIESIL